MRRGRSPRIFVEPGGRFGVMSGQLGYLATGSSRVTRSSSVMMAKLVQHA